MPQYPVVIPPPKPTPPKPNPKWTIPPAEYDHTYNGALQITIAATDAELHARCRFDPETIKNKYMMACATHPNGGCHVIMLPDDVIRATGWTTGLLLRHELAHCNGWPGDHPNIRAYKD
jgi:hypothetical protein